MKWLELEHHKSPQNHWGWRSNISHRPNKNGHGMTRFTCTFRNEWRCDEVISILFSGEKTIKANVVFHTPKVGVFHPCFIFKNLKAWRKWLLLSLNFEHLKATSTIKTFRILQNEPLWLFGGGVVLKPRNRTWHFAQKLSQAKWRTPGIV